MNFCEHYPLCAVAYVSPQRALFTRLRCGSWSCDYCAKKNAEIWRAHLIDKLPEISENWWFVTLTAHEHKRSAALSLKNIRDNLDRLFKRMRRIWKDIQYVRVYEKHTVSDARHAHLVMSGLSPFVAKRISRNKTRAFVPLMARTHVSGTWTVKTWVKKTCRELGMGYMAHVVPVNHSGNAIAYVTKYLTKTFQDLHEKGLRHVQTSRGIGSPQASGELEWQVCSFVSARQFSAGCILIDLQTGQAVDSAYFEEFDYYPPEMS